MSEQVSFSLRGRNPDVLTCIANLSNDEVFTPPEFANRMLDTLAEAWATDNDGANLWAEKSVRFLDPCTKSGVFLREITSRLTNGLEAAIPDLETRVHHILTKQVFGIGITQLTSLLARRSVYCSKHANGANSIGKTGFTSDSGNIWFERLEHTWVGDKCKFCGAPKATFDRGEGLETHAYAFLHTDTIKTRVAELFGENMQFDVVIGNPPYQLNDGGYGTSAAPIYQLFIEKALELDPQYAVFVTPSRWMAGGKGLDKFREKMLKDKRMQRIMDYPKLYEGFPGVKIRGGISYFVWSRTHNGPCAVQTIWDGEPTGPAVARNLDAFDILVRRNEAVPILEKVKAKNEATLYTHISSRKPFGLPTNFRGKQTKEGFKNPVRLFENQRSGWIERKEITINPVWIDKWKVLMTAVQGTSAAIETKFLSKPIVAEPGTACTETYLVAGHFDTEEQANNFAKYLRTRFVRFLVSLRKATQHATRDVYAFVPDLPLDEEWTDAKLYKRYGLTKDEIAFIESQVAEHDKGLFDETSADDSDDE
ncbi:Eco57I restriction-modification methylase domain-containing protein [Armatimonas sp.]|uniref:Eco57I restriction-modification methylase domain-containing protein n=1 Tax=Armatimonas sp. TaxID=1872638 RepID=UPI00374D1FA2